MSRDKETAHVDFTPLKLLINGCRARISAFDVHRMEDEGGTTRTWLHFKTKEEATGHEQTISIEASGLLNIIGEITGIPGRAQAALDGAVGVGKDVASRFKRAFDAFQSDGT